MQRFFSTLPELEFSVYPQTAYFLISLARIVTNVVNGAPVGFGFADLWRAGSHHAQYLAASRPIP